MNIKLAMDCASAWEYIITEQCPWMLNDPCELWLVEFVKMSSEGFEFRRVKALKRLKHNSGKL